MGEGKRGTENASKGIGRENRNIRVERGEKRGENGEGKGAQKGTMERLRVIERKMEWRERKERKKNVIMKGVEVKEGKRREAVERVLDFIGARVDVEEVKKIGRDGEKEGEMILVRLGNEEQKEVMERKAKLRGRRERIMEDWTWRERRMR